jgi:hypothetical protein
MFLKLMIDNHQKHIALTHSLFGEIRKYIYQRIVGFQKTIHSNKYQVQNALLVLQKVTSPIDFENYRTLKSTTSAKYDIAAYI